jgi:type IV pilus assembly protein PilA
MQTKLRNIMSSKKGFTLIELLVVIGILAVLAAIAIPSVAGLIDRANVSADKTNANEMTNAIERFCSEYELYLQDISSGTLDFNKLDSAQGRVRNVIDSDDGSEANAADKGTTSRAEITALEVAQTTACAPEATGTAQLYRDTKYPVNGFTLKKIVENYTKTSSATFAPKQSDCHFFYSPDCGVVVCEVATAKTTDLNKLVISGMDAKGNALDADTQWIDITDWDAVPKS